MKPPKSGIVNEKAKRLLVSNLRKDLLAQGQKITLNILKQEADKFLADLKEAIESQTLNMKPLNRKYKAWKIRKGLDPRILIATGKLLAAYQVQKLPPGHGDGYVINVARRKQRGVWLSTIDRAHEYGTGHLPARPHWRPVIAKFKIRKQEVALRISQELAKTVRVRASR
jgi:hypothetical protein